VVRTLVGDACFVLGFLVTEQLHVCWDMHLLASAACPTSSCFCAVAVIVVDGGCGGNAYIMAAAPSRT